MKKIAIWGAGEFGQSLTNSFPLDDGDEFVFYVDNALGLSRNLPVITCQDLINKSQIDIDEVWVAIKDYYALGDVVFQMHEVGLSMPVCVVDWEKWQIYLNKGGIVAKKCLWGKDLLRKAVLTKLEFHVCDHCNLNCAGCTHFAPIYKDSIASLDEFSNDMESLSKDFYILRLRLMGGEPFLNPDLPEFIEVARKHFPHSHLEIVTNGLLLPKATEACFESIKKNEAFVQISLYPPTFAMRNEISRTLEAYDIEYSFGSGLVQANEEGIIREFHQCFTGVKEGRGKEAAKRCLGNSCHFLRHGKISKCALPLLAGDVNTYFGKSLEVQPGDYVDIYDDNTEPWEKVRNLRRAIPFCDYCGDGTSTRFEWKCGGEIVYSDYLK